MIYAVVKVDHPLYLMHFTYEEFDQACKALSLEIPELDSDEYGGLYVYPDGEAWLTPVPSFNDVYKWEYGKGQRTVKVQTLNGLWWEYHISDHEFEAYEAAVMRGVEYPPYARGSLFHEKKERGEVIRLLSGKIDGNATATADEFISGWDDR